MFPYFVGRHLVHRALFYPLARSDMFQTFHTHYLFQFVHLDHHRLNDLTDHSNDQTSLLKSL